MLEHCPENQCTEWALAYDLLRELIVLHVAQPGSVWPQTLDGTAYGPLRDIETYRWQASSVQRGQQASCGAANLKHRPSGVVLVQEAQNLLVLACALGLVIDVVVAVEVASID